MKRNATATWNGPGTTGTGNLDAPSGFFNQTPFSTKTRFENEDGKAGTNPEELIAAAQSACFCMSLSFGIAHAGFVADELKATTTVTIDTTGTDFTITGIHISLIGTVSGMEKEEFETLANATKMNCPVAKALSAVPISLQIEFRD